MAALQNMIGTTSLNLQAEKKKMMEGLQNNDEFFFSHRQEFVWLTEWWSENKVDLNATTMKSIISGLKAHVRRHAPANVDEWM